MTAKVTPDQLRQYGHIALALKGALSQKGWTGAELSRQLGYANNAVVGNWLACKNGISEKERPRVAELLGLSSDALRPKFKTATSSAGRPPKLATDTSQALTVYQPKAEKKTAPTRTDKVVVMVMPLADAQTMLEKLLKG